ncbi:hypothetical protein L9F63_005577, partial [Diploptera punctata]
RLTLNQVKKNSARILKGNSITPVFPVAYIFIIHTLSSGYIYEELDDVFLFFSRLSSLALFAILLHVILIIMRIILSNHLICT